MRKLIAFTETRLSFCADFKCVPLIIFCKAEIYYYASMYLYV